MNKKKIVEARNLHKTYRSGGTETKVLRGCSLEINEGDFISICGPSGVGKSTLLHIIGCLDTPTRGILKFEGKEIQKYSELELTEIRRKKIGFVFQSFHLIPTLTALENVKIQLLLSGVPKHARSDIASKSLEIVGLGKKLDNFPRQLSGGELQRVAIARAISKNPRLLLADEPTGNLDSETGEMIGDIFKTLNEQGLTILMVTHNPYMAKKADKIFWMKDGRIIR
jgi:putative ABC transport system ATP-binding protein